MMPLYPNSATNTTVDFKLCSLLITTLTLRDQKLDT